MYGVCFEFDMYMYLFKAGIHQHPELTTKPFLPLVSATSINKGVLEWNSGDHWKLTFCSLYNVAVYITGKN